MTKKTHELACAVTKACYVFRAIQITMKLIHQASGRLSTPAFHSQGPCPASSESPSNPTKRSFLSLARAKLRILPAMLTVLSGTLSVSTAQVSIPGTSPVVQNFDSIGATTTAALPASWKMSVAGAGLTAGYATVANVTAVTQGASTGSPSTGGRYNWGNGTTTTDRAVGFMTSSGYASPNSVMVQYTNNTGSTITALAIAFDIERYRINTAAASVTFFTSTDGATWTAQTAGDSGAFATGASAYNFTTGTVVNKSLSVSGLSIGTAASIYLKWNFDTVGSNSQGLGLDNVSVTATTSGLPSPAITSFAPASGWVGTSVTLTGTYFTGASAVKFNGTDATSFTVNSDTEIVCAAPTGVTTGKISVVTTNGTGDSLTNFTAVNPDSLTLSASPTSFAENAVNPASVGTVTRIGTTGDLIVNLSSSAVSHATVPSTVTILGGSSSATFDITAIPDNTVTANNTVTITASANSFSIGADVTVTNVDLAPLTVVINKIAKTATSNGAGDRIELLVVGSQTPGSTVDMRGMVLKDFSNGGVDDAGGAYQFASTTFWSAVPVGTLIVVEIGNTASPDIVASDFVLSLGAGDTTYFTQTTAFGINIGASDLIMIKTAGLGVAGNVGGIHALALGTPTSFYTSFAGAKLNAIATGDNLAAIANNSTSTLADYNGGTATGALAAASVTFGVANNTTNNTYIAQLRGGLSNGYAVWINTYYNGVNDPLIIGFTADPDLDGIPNGVEALIGGDPSMPGVFSTTELVKTGNVFTFLYPQDNVLPSGVTAAYEWSTDLTNWQASGGSFGGVTVTLAGDLYDDSTYPDVDIYQVTATVTVGTAPGLFVRVVAHN